MGVIETRTNQDGDRVAAILPDALGIPVDFALRLEWEGQTVRLSPATEDVESKRTWTEVLARLAAIGSTTQREVKDLDILSDQGQPTA